MLAGFVLYILLAIVVGLFGQDRKFGFWGYLFASLLLTPLLGIVLVLGSDRRTPG